jgi:hypothetical protein
MVTSGFYMNDDDPDCTMTKIACYPTKKPKWETQETLNRNKFYAGTKKREQAGQGFPAHTFRTARLP